MRAGIAEVQAALLDPNPLVNGGGIAALEAAGVRVAVGEGADEARALMEGYLHWTATGRPLVVAKFAMSLDGKIATPSGESQWITGNEARRYAHGLRAAADAVAVGVGTALQDDPRLTARDGHGEPMPHQPLRVVVDSTGRVPPGARLFQGPGQVLVAVAHVARARERRLRNSGAQVLRLPAEDGRVDIRALLQALGERGVTSLLVEGGGRLLASLFEGRMVDRVEAFVAPMLIGGRDALTAVEGDGVTRLANAVRLDRVTVDRLGEDIHIVGYPQMEGESVHGHR
jgi:diaminohydroxyphosphoribosylaminopyrimidine deaminase/5-amino-6-(5-phosphoribosylamino)uracil reductase